MPVIVQFGPSNDLPRDSAFGPAQVFREGTLAAKIRHCVISRKTMYITMGIIGVGLLVAIAVIAAEMVGHVGGPRWGSKRGLDVGIGSSPAIMGENLPVETFKPTTFLTVTTSASATPTPAMEASTLLALQRELVDRQSIHHKVMKEKLEGLMGGLSVLSKDGLEGAGVAVEEMMKEMGDYEGFLDGVVETVEKGMK